MAQTVQHELRLETFSHVQKQGWFNERQKGDILAILNDDINQLERFLTREQMIASSLNNCCGRWCIYCNILASCFICNITNPGYCLVLQIPAKS